MADNRNRGAWISCMNGRVYVCVTKCCACDEWNLDGVIEQFLVRFRRPLHPSLCNRFCMRVWCNECLINLTHNPARRRPLSFTLLPPFGLICGKYGCRSYSNLRRMFADKFLCFQQVFRLKLDPIAHCRVRAIWNNCKFKPVSADTDVQSPEKVNAKHSLHNNLISKRDSRTSKWPHTKIHTKKQKKIVAPKR